MEKCNRPVSHFPSAALVSLPRSDRTGGISVAGFATPLADQGASNAVAVIFSFPLEGFHWTMISCAAVRCLNKGARMDSAPLFSADGSPVEFHARSFVSRPYRRS